MVAGLIRISMNKIILALLIIPLLQSCENYRSVNIENIGLMDGDRIIVDDPGYFMTNYEAMEMKLKRKDSYSQDNSLFMDLLDIFF